MAFQQVKRDWISPDRLGMLGVAMVTVLTLALASAHAQTFTVLHNFSGGSDGSTPAAGLTIDRGGNLYGTAANGGRFFVGTVFKLAQQNSSWIFTPLHEFQQSNGDGNEPAARVVIGPNGSLYGTTSVGGQFACEDDHGCGTVFNLRPPATACKNAFCSWTENQLYRFNGPDGAVPVGDLIFDRAGLIYGVTWAGGNPECEFFAADDCGVVYTLTNSDTEDVIYKFPGGSDGSYPQAGVTFDSAGDLLGTTTQGGAPNLGTIYELTPSHGGWTGTTIYQFQGGNDGATPYAGLVFDQAGNAYGATTVGGANGGGTVFQLTPSGSSWIFSVIYSFTGNEGPVANLTVDQAGNLYGTTIAGGAFNMGAVFKLTNSNGNWTYTSLHDFTGGSDGQYPACTPVFDTAGNLYGTAELGGSFGDGVVFQIAP